jgi:hypothetical protein
MASRLNASPSSERLRAFLADYHAEKRRAYKTEFEAVDAKIFANRLAPLLLSDERECPSAGSKAELRGIPGTVDVECRTGESIRERGR